MGYPLWAYRGGQSESEQVSTQRINEREETAWFACFSPPHPPMWIGKMIYSLKSKGKLSAGERLKRITWHKISVWIRIYIFFPRWMAVSHILSHKHVGNWSFDWEFWHRKQFNLQTFVADEWGSDAKPRGRQKEWTRKIPIITAHSDEWGNKFPFQAIEFFLNEWKKEMKWIFEMLKWIAKQNTPKNLLNTLENGTTVE